MRRSRRAKYVATSGSDAENCDHAMPVLCSKSLASIPMKAAPAENMATITPRPNRTSHARLRKRFMIAPPRVRLRSAGRRQLRDRAPYTLHHREWPLRKRDGVAVVCGAQHADGPANNSLERTQPQR